jgi:hypothetical protein
MPSNHRKGNSQSKEQPGHDIQEVTTTPAQTSQLAPTYTDKHQSIDRIPPPQAWRVKSRFVAGQTIRAIARTEHLNRRTVTKIVRGQDVKDYVSGLREQFYGLGDAALDAVKHALIEGKDARLGFEILKSIGVMPSGEERIQPQNQAPMGDEEARVRETMVKLAACAIERNRVFNTPLPNISGVEERNGG